MSRFDLGPGVNELKALLSNITDDDLRKPTPCPLFDVAAVVAHVGGFAQAFTAAAHKADSDLVEQQPSPQPMPLPDNWRERIPRDLNALADAWRVPDAWTGTTRIAAQDAPAEMVAMTVADEIVVHTWDL